MGAWLAKSVAPRWNAFFHGPADATLLALLRIGYASLVLVQWAAMLPFVDLLWSEGGVLPLERLSDAAGGFVPTLFYVLPRSQGVLVAAYVFFGIHAFCVLVGHRTRFHSVLLLVWLVSFQNRNPLAVNGQDALLRLIGFFLLLLPTGNALSFDARRGRLEGAASAWPLRLLQIQVAFVMFSAGLWKLIGDDWTNGSALHYVTRLEGLWGNLPLPAALTDSTVALRIGTFGVLGLELALPIAVWIPKLRKSALAVAVSFHLALAYAMNLFLFPWIMILGWCSFLRREDFSPRYERTPS